MAEYKLDETFEQVDFNGIVFPKGDYEGCSFIKCNIANADLSNINFTECRFINCDVSSAKLLNTTLNDVQFQGCKMLGLHFDGCNEFVFSIRMEECVLNLSSFYKRKMKKMLFKKCSMHEVDLTETDLSAAVFEDCDLKGAIFENTILEKADLRRAINYTIDPLTNKIKKARFSVPAVTGLLYKHDIDIS